jgi:hypothetical protein
MLTIKLLHVLFAIAAIASTYGPTEILVMVARGGDVRTIRNTFGAATRLAPVHPILFGVSALFGVIAIIQGSLNFLEPWLIIGYVLFVIGMIEGAVISGSWQKNIARIAAASPEDAPSPELVALIHDRGAAVWRLIGYVVMVLLTVDMILKPFR